jgi:Putative metallopeptidase
MWRFVGVLAVATILVVAPELASAQIPPQLQNSRIGFIYDAPRSPKFRPLYDRLKKRQLLEELKAFLSPLRLPRKLVLNTKECGETNAFYSRSVGLVLCYEYIEFMEGLAPKETTPEGFTRAEGIAGAFVEVTLHELGHAVFDNLDVPVFGREEDAADQMAGFLMLQFSPDLALLTVKGAAWSYLSQERAWADSKFSDEHGTERQRFYNYLCLGYGGMRDQFRDMVDKGLLPAARARNCAREYQQVRKAFAATVLPFIDPHLMKAVQGVRWLRPEEMR